MRCGASRAASLPAFTDESPLRREGFEARDRCGVVESVSLPRHRFRFTIGALAFGALATAIAVGWIDSERSELIEGGIALLALLAAVRTAVAAVAPGPAVTATAEGIRIGVATTNAPFNRTIEIPAIELSGIVVEPGRSGLVRRWPSLVFLRDGGPSVAVPWGSFEEAQHFAGSAFELMPPRA